MHSPVAPMESSVRGGSTVTPGPGFTITVFPAATGWNCSRTCAGSVPMREASSKRWPRPAGRCGIVESWFQTSTFQVCHCAGPDAPETGAISGAGGGEIGGAGLGAGGIGGGGGGEGRGGGRGGEGAIEAEGEGDTEGDGAVEGVGEGDGGVAVGAGVGEG